MNYQHTLSSSKALLGEILEASLIVSFSVLLIEQTRCISDYDTCHTESISHAGIDSIENIHETFYTNHKEILEKRFPFRKHNDPLTYIRQVLIVFGSATLGILIFIKRLRLQRTFKDVSGWDVAFVSCALNLIFAYAFGFVAVVNDWWFFFPDLITPHIWTIQRGQMVLGDILFYPMATIMGFTTIILVTRMQTPIKRQSLDTLLKTLWFTIAFTVILFGVTFGSMVTKGMIYWLYIPFCTAGILLYNRYSGFELWSVTTLFIGCEFLWDVFARIRGIWIFPDQSTHPGLYFNEIALFTINNIPVIWQPEMTQMAFMSGMICIVFFHLARHLLNKGPLKIS
jgi:hypothetical protein